MAGAKRRREKACKYAARVLASQYISSTDAPLIPHAWSLVVFFESYLARGADGTAKEFGPKKPVKLKVAR